MQTFLHKKFNFNIKQYIKDSESFLITLSGGQDSLCLLKLISDYFGKRKNHIQAIYIDHQWKKNSVKNIEHIGKVAKLFKIPISIYEIKNLHISENEARKIRYKIFIQHAIQHECDNIVTGHNQNDQIETLLQNLLRGSSLNGITNFATKKNIKQKVSIIRPLINFTRAEIAWFCRSFCLPIWSDSTNYNYYIERNRIRQELIPYLKNYFNEKIDYTLKDFMKLCQNDNEYLRENSLKLHLKIAHSKLIGLNLKTLKKQHHTLQKRVIQLHLHYHFKQKVNETIIQLILNSSNQNSIKQEIHIKNLVIQQNNGWLYTYINK